tara:strand:- start:753 stop:1022 length:270 start_codon:yes stop_codon:yes gene_type:complete
MDLNNSIEKTDLSPRCKEWLKTNGSMFVRQFLFYYVDVGHSYEKALNRSITETGEIIDEYKCRFYHVLDDQDLPSEEKIIQMRNLLQLL